ncbi:MAG: helix-turn-helix transcriptional regulator [Lachnospiraceae bacterium]|nr:helix-turn-helix transcriptional regulator [Lachnospiraceae bacterium]
MEACEGKEKFCQGKKQMLSEGQDSILTQIANEKGQYLMTAYQVLPGITFIYNDAHIQQVCFEERKTVSNDMIEISHCREGRLECNIHGEFCYLTPGDLAIAQTNSISGRAYFPLCHYHGLTIQVDLKKTPQCLSCLLEDVTVSPRAIAEKFCGARGGFITRANSSVEHIFSELYSVPEKIQKGYFKIKALELFLFLSTLDIQQDEWENRICTKSQVTLAKEISQYMMEHMEERITLEHLIEHFHLSGAHLKKTFKGVYGVSIGSYIRNQKMESAAYMLEYTTKSILDIANAHGYDNGSKFASAFRAVKGVNPTEYRNCMAKKAIRNI